MNEIRLWIFNPLPRTKPNQKMPLNPFGKKRPRDIDNDLENGVEQCKNARKSGNCACRKIQHTQDVVENRKCKMCECTTFLTHEM